MLANEKLSQYINTFIVSEPNISNHCKISLEVSLPRKAVGEVEDILSELPGRIKWNEKSKLLFERKLEEETTKKKVREVKELISKEDFTHIDTCVEILNDIYTLDKHVTSGKKGKKNHRKRKEPGKKWYNKTCYETSQRLKNLGKLLEKKPNDPYLRGKLVEVRKDYKRLLKQTRNEWKKEMIDMLEQVEKKNPKEYWDIIKQLKERKAENIICNPGDFRTFYEKLFSLDEDKEQTEEQKRIEKEVIDMLENTGQDDTRRTFSMEELKPAIKKLKNNKAGPDAILAEMLKESPEEILNIILSLINKIVVSCKYPAR